MQEYTPKNVFGQPLSFKKIAVIFVIFFFQQSFFLYSDSFLIQKKRKNYEDSYFSVFLRLNVSNPLQNKPNTD